MIVYEPSWDRDGFRRGSSIRGDAPREPGAIVPDGPGAVARDGLDGHRALPWGEMRQAISLWSGYVNFSKNDAFY